MSGSGHCLIAPYAKDTLKALVLGPCQGDCRRADSPESVFCRVQLSWSDPEETHAGDPDKPGPEAQPASDAVTTSPPAPEARADSPTDSADVQPIDVQADTSTAPRPARVDWVQDGTRWAEVSIGLLCSGEDASAMPFALRLRGQEDPPMHISDAIVSAAPGLWCPSADWLATQCKARFLGLPKSL